MTSKTAMARMDDAPSSVPVRLLVAVFVSGAAGLMYQLVWMRSFSLVIGSAHTAVAAVLAAYMGGLAIGGLLGG